MTASQVIAAVRTRLGDSKQERWDTATLTLYVSLCQSDICMHSSFYRRTSEIQLESDTYVYALPSDFLALSRLEYGGVLFPLESRNTIDDGTALFPCALKDNLNLGFIEIKIGEGYVTLEKALIDTFGVVTDQSTDAIDTSSCELEEIYGVVSDVEIHTGTPEPTPPLDQLRLYYVAMPPTVGIEYVEEELLLPDIWFTAFMHFVTGMALQDDNDANNIQRGQLEDAKYARILANIMSAANKDFTTNVKTKLATSYRRT